MAHRSAGAAHAALTAVGALLLTGLPVAFAAEQPVPATGSAPLAAGAASRGGEPSAALLSALQRELHLTPQQARERLGNEAEAGTRAGHLQIALGKNFAGAWVRGQDSANLTVATTDAADAPVIEAAGAEAQVVRYGLGELRDAAAKLDRAAAGAKGLDTPVRYVDVRRNRVTVQAARSDAAEALAAAAGVDRAIVNISLSPERPRALYDIVGGDAFYVQAGRCSVGFSVTKGDDQGFATAGHCGTAGTTTTGFNMVAQGTFQASTFPGKDTAWVKAEKDWTATPQVSGAGGENVQVAGSTQALVGAAVCRSGSTSGWHCGEIEQHDTSVSYPEGTVNGVTRTTVCAEPGDSGGPYISGSQAQGVTSGGSGDCTSGGTTYFQPVNPLLETYGLVLKTTAAQSGDTPGAETTQGSWAAGHVYRVGDEVTYNGVTYRCVQTHQAQGAGQPAGTPALWERT